MVKSTFTVDPLLLASALSLRGGKVYIDIAKTQMLALEVVRDAVVAVRHPRSRLQMFPCWLPIVEVRIAWSLDWILSSHKEINIRGKLGGTATFTAKCDLRAVNDRLLPFGVELEVSLERGLDSIRYLSDCAPQRWEMGRRSVLLDPDDPKEDEVYRNGAKFGLCQFTPHMIENQFEWMWEQRARYGNPDDFRNHANPEIQAKFGHLLRG